MAYTLNGSTQYFSASPPILGVPMTLACWFRPSNMANPQALVGVSSSGAGVYFTLYFRGDKANDPVESLDVQSGLGQIATTSTTGCTQNQWHHACCTKQNAAATTIYLDGGSSASQTFTHNATQTVTAFNIGRFPIGGNPYNGDIAEVGIWDVVLTEAEVISLARGMTCDKVRPQSLVYYSPLVRNITDLSGGLTITNNGTATVAAHPRVYA